MRLLTFLGDWKSRKSVSLDRTEVRPVEVSRRFEETSMTNDAAAQLVILTDALTEIVDLTTAPARPAVQPADLLDRMSEIAASALIAAATYGQLPPFPSEPSQYGETLN